MKTIVQVFGSLDAGGAESRMMDVFRAIDRKKYNFVFISLDTKDNQFYETEIRSLGGRIIKIASPRDVGICRHLSEMLHVFRTLRAKGVNVVHSHTSYHSGLVLTVARIAGIKVRIAHARTTSSVNTNSVGQRGMIALGKNLIKLNATMMLALNNETALALYGHKVDGKHIRTLPNAINLELYHSPSVACDLDDLPKNIPVIGHIGRFQPMKNHKFLIEFFYEFNKIHNESVLVMVGDGPLRAEIEKYVRQLDMQNNVRFLGLRKDVPNILKRIDLFVFPSIFEGLGGSVVEAQATGIPCLVSDTLPRTVDMGLGLVNFLSLKSPMSSWLSSAQKAIQKDRLDFQTIYKAFDNRGFTLESEIKQLIPIYENSYDNNDNI